MSASAWLGFILTAGAVLEISVGLGLLLVPTVIAELLLRAPLDGTGLVIARLAGGGLLAVGLACWAVRRTPTTPAGLGVCRAFLAYNVVACAVLVRAYPPLPGSRGPRRWHPALLGCRRPSRCPLRPGAATPRTLICRRLTDTTNVVSAVGVRLNALDKRLTHREETLSKILLGRRPWVAAIAFLLVSVHAPRAQKSQEPARVDHFLFRSLVRWALQRRRRFSRNGQER